MDAHVLHCPAMFSALHHCTVIAWMNSMYFCTSYLYFVLLCFYFCACTLYYVLLYLYFFLEFTEALYVLCQQMHLFLHAVPLALEP